MRDKRRSHVKELNMQVSDLVFVGFNSRIAALHRGSGQIMWNWKSPKGSGYVILMLDGDILIASINGYTYGIDALSGNTIWFNPLDGFGVGVPSIASSSGSVSALQAIAGEVARQRSSAAAAAGAAGAASS